MKTAASMKEKESQRMPLSEKQTTLSSPPSAAVEDSLLPVVLLGLTFVTGLVDAVSWLGLSHVFTALQTGNLLILAFAVAQTPGLSIYSNLTSLVAFLAGALLGGRLMSRIPTNDKHRLVIFEAIPETLLLFAAATLSIGFNSATVSMSNRVFVIIAFLALAMGLRSAVVRKLGVADLTTTLLTLTMTGILSESSAAGGKNPRIVRRVAAVILLFVGALLGALLLKIDLSIPLFIGGAFVLTMGIWTYHISPK